MKTTDSRDPLDQKIDKLLASQPAKAPTNFAARTLAEVEALPHKEQPRVLAPILRFALPLAAAIALAFVIYNQFSYNGTEVPARTTTQAGGSGYVALDSQADEALTTYEIQELLMLQEGLSGFVQIESEELSTGDLLDTLDTLYSI